MKDFNIHFKYFLYRNLISLSFIFCYISSFYSAYVTTNITDIKNFIDDPNESFIPIFFLDNETDLFTEYLISTLEDEETAGNPNCLYYLAEILKNSTMPVYKFIQDSSHSLSKLGSYQDCKNKVYYNKTLSSKTKMNLNYTYILFYTPPNSLINQSAALFSVCVPEIDECKDVDYSYILQSFNTKTEFFDDSQIGGIEVYILNDEIKKLNNKCYIGFLVIGIFVFIFLCEIFPSIPVFLFKCCFKKKIDDTEINDLNSKDSKKNKKIEIYETMSLLSLEKSFSLKDSIGEIYGTEVNTGINNDSGISFLKGLRGICLMLYILGETLQSVYQYPVKKNEKLYFNTNSLSFLYFFNRFTKNLFLSLSSFSLCYKILCYFDNEIEKNELKNVNIKLDDINPDLINNTLKEDEEEVEIKSKKSKKTKFKKSLSSNIENKSIENNSGLNLKKGNTNSNSSSSSISSFSKSGKKSFSSGDLTKMPSMSQFNSIILDIKVYHKIAFKSYLVFLFRQFYKYFLFISIVLIIRYIYYDYVSIMRENPMWEFIKKSFINKFESKHMLAIIFLYFPFYSKVNEDVAFAPFNIVILEISLFILFSLIFFIVYKTNIRFDFVIIFLFFAGIAGKIISYILILRKKKSVTDEYFYPSMGFTNKDYKYILNNLLYYIPSISIGLFFGLVNYAIQKSAQDIKYFKDKVYLNIPIIFTNLLRKKPVFFSFLFSIFFIAIFIWCGLSYNILFLSDEKLMEDPLATGFYKKDSINIYYSLDVDIMVFSIFLAIIPYTLIGENFVISFLKHEYWNILAKPYYSYMLIIQITGNNILYRINTLVELKFYYIFFFSIINFIFGIVLGSILYTFLEVPLKKLNKFILSKKKDNKNIDEENDEQDDDQILDEDEKISDSML